MQERIETPITEAFIEHKPVDIFLINTHAFHNAHLIRAILPRDLTAPIPYAPDRRSHHDQIAQNLRVVRDSKRAAVALKAAEKKKVMAGRQPESTAGASADATDSHGVAPPEIRVPARRKRKRMEGSRIDADDDRMDVNKNFTDGCDVLMMVEDR